MKKSLLPFAILGLILFISCGQDDPEPDGGDDVEFTISFSSNSSTVSEDVGSVTITVTSNVSNETGSSLSINYTVSGTATAGSDFSGLNGTVNIPDGSSQASITVNVTDDNETESNETIIISPVASGNVLSGSSLTLTITDNDSGQTTCANDNSTDQSNHACDTDTNGSNYSESVSGNTRTIQSSGIPDHTHGNQFDDFPMNDPNYGVKVTNQNFTFTVTTSPAIANQTTSISSNSGPPAYKFGVAVNGVPVDPAPATPFIFENDGEYIWDWVFEPNNNMDAVGLDCAIAHVQPDGAYHYHGDMTPLADGLSTGISSGTAPNAPVHIGWAADGFPIVYRYGPSSNGQGIELLTSSYQLKSGERPGDGDSAPCGTYNGKYTNDYEYSASAGDLDECNGISRNIMIGGATFSYFYVITEDFPIIPRCFSGTPNSSFAIGGGN